MTINEQPLTPSRWRRLHPHLRTELRQILGGTQAILNRPVLDVTSALCEHGRPDVALAFYDALTGQPGAIYGCGVGAMWAPKQYMDEQGPDPTRTILVMTSVR